MCFEANLRNFEIRIRNIVKIKILILCYSFDHLSVNKVINLEKRKRFHSNMKFQCNSKIIGTIFRAILLFRSLVLIFDIEVIILIPIIFFLFKMYTFVLYNCYKFIIFIYNVLSLET